MVDEQTEAKDAETAEEAAEEVASDPETPAIGPDTLQKPLDKMTVKELKDVAKEIPSITGVHGMVKSDLLAAIKEAWGIAEEPTHKADASVQAMKHQIKALKVQRQAALEAQDKKMATIYKRRISRLKKKTRRSAA